MADAAKAVDAQERDPWLYSLTTARLICGNHWWSRLFPLRPDDGYGTNLVGRDPGKGGQTFNGSVPIFARSKAGAANTRMHR